MSCESLLFHMSSVSSRFSHSLCSLFPFSSHCLGWVQDIFLGLSSQWRFSGRKKTVIGSYTWRIYNLKQEVAWSIKIKLLCCLLIVTKYDSIWKTVKIFLNIIYHLKLSYGYLVILKCWNFKVNVFEDKMSETWFVEILLG